MAGRLGHIALMSVVLGLTGCSLAEEVQSRLFDSKVNLTESTYAAAEMLAPQAKTRITQATPIRLAVLTDVAAPTEATPFGTQIANQLGSRFVQLGYNVQSVPLPPGAMDTPITLTPQIHSAAPHPTRGPVKPSMGKGGDVLIGGTYARFRDTIQVSLKITQAPDQRVIAAYDYSLPLTQELKDLSMTAADRKRKEQGWFPTFVSREEMVNGTTSQPQFQPELQPKLQSRPMPDPQPEPEPVDPTPQDVSQSPLPPPAPVRSAPHPVAVPSQSLQQ